MSIKREWTDQVYQSLRQFGETTFPSTCTDCGRTFESLDAFLSEMRSDEERIEGSGSVQDESNQSIVDLFRNCVCGAKVLELSGERRDTSEGGRLRRKGFGELLSYLSAAGLDREVARQELLKVLHGKKSTLFQNITPEE